MGMPSGVEIFVILAIVLLLFGGKKIPELAKGLGSGIKNFKKAMKDDEVVENDKKLEETKESQTTTEKSEKKEEKKA